MSVGDSVPAKASLKLAQRGSLGAVPVGAGTINTAAPAWFQGASAVSSQAPVWATESETSRRNVAVTRSERTHTTTAEGMLSTAANYHTGRRGDVADRASASRRRHGALRARADGLRRPARGRRAAHPAHRASHPQARGDGHRRPL